MMRYLFIELNETGKESNVYDVYCNGQLAGKCCFTVENGRLSLNDIVLEDEFWNRGIATAIIRNLARQYGLPIFLTDDAGKKGLYENRGFVNKETGSCKKWGKPLTIRISCTMRLLKHFVFARVKIIREGEET